MKKFYVNVEPKYQTVATLEIPEGDFNMMSSKQVSFIVNHFASVNNIDEWIDIETLIDLVDDHGEGMVSDRISVAVDGDLIIITAENQIGVDAYLVDEHNNMVDI